MKLSRIGEDALIASLLRQLPASRKLIGDDCAVVEFRGAKNLLVLKTDCVVEKIHFESRTNPDAQRFGKAKAMYPRGASADA